MKKTNYILERKHEFLREVYNFLVSKKQGLDTNHFLIEELEAYLLSQETTFTQVFSVINTSYYTFVFSGGGDLLD